MEKEQILKELEKIFKSVLEEDNLIITEDMETSNIQGWDSLAQINLIEEVEKHFKIHFTLWNITRSSISTFSKYLPLSSASAVAKSFDASG